MISLLRAQCQSFIHIRPCRKFSIELLERNDHVHMHLLLIGEKKHESKVKNKKVERNQYK